MKIHNGKDFWSGLMFIGFGLGFMFVELALLQRLSLFLGHPAYADHWATKWADLVRPNTDRVGIKGVLIIDQWLRKAFRENLPYDRFVREILLADIAAKARIVMCDDERGFVGVRVECLPQPVELSLAEISSTAFSMP